MQSKTKIGVWRSWLAHLHGVQGVESSSLFTPTFLYIPISFAIEIENTRKNKNGGEKIGKNQGVCLFC